MKWVARTSRNPKHAGVVFIMDGPTFVAKTYNHDGTDGAATAKLIIDRVNGWDDIVAQRDAALLTPWRASYMAMRDERDALRREVDELNARIGNLT